MEKLFETDLRNVRVLTESPAAELLRARAFAYRDRIYFAPGEYNPWSGVGWSVIAHEIAHVVQQREGRVPASTGLFLCRDEQLEREAHRAEEMARELRITGKSRGRVFAAKPSSRHPAGHAIQCLMDLKTFQTDSKASGFRNKIKVVDQELQAYLTLDARQPRDYAALLAQIRKLYKACQDYRRANPTSERLAGLAKLEKAIGLEEVVLVPLAKYSQEADPLKKWEALEEAQENCLKVEDRDDFKRKNCNVEILQLINALKNTTRNTPVDAAMVQRDIDELKKLAQRDSLPAVLKDVITEVTAAGNLRQLDMKVWMPGAAYNTADGAVQKFTLKHELEQGLGKKWRLGSLLHELTHISIAEIFDNTVMMLAIRKTAADDEMLALAANRKGKIVALKNLISTSVNLDGTLKREMLDKANYPLCGKFGIYLANFKKFLDDPTYQRLKGLLTRGMDCELIEYDTVINQMSLWCSLTGLDQGHPVFTDLLTLAKEAYMQRMSGRLAPPVKLVRSGSTTKLPGQKPQLQRRGSFG